MGMFDNIRFENEIPDAYLRGETWQTKSLENGLLDYRITKDGELIVKRQKFEFVEAPNHILGMQQNVVAEWEEKVEHHGVIEAYYFQPNEDDSAHSTIYDLYFTHGRLERLERRVKEYPAPRPIEELTDPSPITSTQVGDYTLHLPSSIVIRHAAQEGDLLLLRLEHPGIMNIRPTNRKEPKNTLHVATRLTPRSEEEDEDRNIPVPIVDGAGRIERADGSDIQLLMERRKPVSSRNHPYFGPTDLIALIAPADLLDD